MEPHLDFGERCLVMHYAGDYWNPNVLPPCIRCARCLQWIRPERFTESCAVGHDGTVNTPTAAA